MFKINLKRTILSSLGSLILAFGLYHIHSFADITEGGILGLTLLLEHWFHISPAISGLIFNTVCYIVAWRLLGKEFLYYSFVSGISFSIYYAIIERFNPLWPNLVNHQMLASILGALFVGIGVGLSVRAGGASGGDDAIAMSIAHISSLAIEDVYLISDLIVLFLSLTYIPLNKIIYSTISCILSGQIIGYIQTFKKH